MAVQSHPYCPTKPVPSSHIYFPKRLPSSLFFPSLFTSSLSRIHNPLTMDASSKAPPPQASTPSKQPTEQQIRETTSIIREQLHKLRLDDMASLALQKGTELNHPILDEQISWIRLSMSNLFHYFRYLYTTWGSIAIK